MARKNVIPSFKMLNEIDLTTNATSPATVITHLDRASVFIDWSGSDAVGEVQFEARKIDKDKPVADADWRTLDFGATIDITGASGNHEVILNSLDFTELRVQYITTSGTTGTLTATLTAKQIGG